MNTVAAKVWLQDLGKGDICSPFANPLDGTLHVIFQKTGEITAVTSFGQLQKVYSTGGQPSSAAFDHDNDRLLVADFAHGAVLALTPDGSCNALITMYEDRPLKGPNSIVVTSSAIFFSDSGALGETGLHSPTGSLFAITQGSSSLLKPLSLSSLAYPAGIAVTNNGKFIYVAEMMANRIVRYFQQPEGVYHGSVFYQLSGAVGPNSIAVDAQGSLYVGVYDTKESAVMGKVLIISSAGAHVGTITTPGPEISGLCIFGNTLYITERSTGAILRVGL